MVPGLGPLFGRKDYQSVGTRSGSCGGPHDAVVGDFARSERLLIAGGPWNAAGVPSNAKRSSRERVNQSAMWSV